MSSSSPPSSCTSAVETEPSTSSPATTAGTTTTEPSEPAPDVRVDRTAPDELVVICEQCGPIGSYPARHAGPASLRRAGHQRRHECPPPQPRERPRAPEVIARAVGLRLNVEQAKARIRMWQACPAMDPARSADQVLVDVLDCLEQQP